MALAVLPLLLPLARGDPSITSGGQGSVEVRWDFNNPANYSLNDTVIKGGQVSLRKTQASWNFTTLADYSNYSSAVNVNVTGRPGEIFLNNTAASLNGTYISKLLGAGPPANWTSLAWRVSAVVANVSDEFNGTTLDPRWSWLNPPTSYSVGSPRPGYLRFTSLLNTNFNNLQHSGQFLYQNITGDFQVDVHLQTSITNTAQKAGIIVMAGLNDWYGHYRRLNTAGSPILRTVTTVAGVTTINGTVIVSPDYLRVRRVGNTLGTWYSLDGVTWFPSVNMGPGVLPASLRVGVMAADNSGTSTLAVDVDYVRFTFSQGAVELQARSGNTTNPSDGSWTPWSSPYPDPNGSALGRQGRYLQYRIFFVTPSPYVRPLVARVTVASEDYVPRGSVTTEALRPGAANIWTLLSVTADPQGGAVQVSHSLDRVRWTAVQPGPLNATVAGALWLRLNLTAPAAFGSPVVRELRLILQVPAGPALGGLPWWLLVLAVAPLAAVVVVLWRRRGTFRPTDLFLIHADGRLVLRVGREDSPMRDDTAVSGMFTLMARFVKDSFAGTQGGKGELKSLKVDDRQVAIVKGEYLFLALLGQGSPTASLEGVMARFLQVVEGRYAPFLRAWDGLGDDLEGLNAELVGFLGRRRGWGLAGKNTGSPPG